jgi:DNA-binding HxlR family transcriptional regulator
MRSYGQYCGLAKALDVIGDRWTLLIVRELMIREACRYTDLRNGLPDVATNLLVERLADLEQAGVVYREEAPPPVATTLFRLTSRGKELEAVLHAIGRWGGPLLAKPRKKDKFCSHWIALPLNIHLRDRTPEQSAVALEIRAGDEAVTVETVGDGSVRARAGAGRRADAKLTGSPQTVLALLLGKIGLKEARAAGVKYEGAPKILHRVTADHPRPPAAVTRNPLP